MVARDRRRRRPAPPPGAARGTLGIAASVVVVVAACADVLGIEDRSRRPVQQGTDGGGAGGTAGAGGTSAGGAVALDEHRAQCLDRHGANDPCWSCVCRECALDVVRQCVESSSCGDLISCVRGSCCPAAAGCDACSAPDGPPVTDAMACLASCTACGPFACGGSGGTSSGPEACNFRDDDGDADVDEGFEWRADPPRPLMPGSEGLRAAATAEGGVAVVSIDGAVGLITSATYPGNPTLTVPLPSGQAWGTAVAGGPLDFRAAAAFSTRPAAGCDAPGGCRVTLVELDLRNGSGRRDAVLSEADLGHRADGVVDLAWLGDGYVLALRRPEGQVVLHWFAWNGSTPTPMTSQTLPHPTTSGTVGSLAVDGSSLGVFYQTGADVRAATLELDGAPRNPDLFRRPGTVPAQRGIAAVAGSYVLAFQDDTRSNVAYFVGADGTVTSQATLDTSCTPVDVVAVDDTPVIACADGPRLRLERRSRDLGRVLGPVQLAPGLEGQARYAVVRRTVDVNGLQLVAQSATGVVTSALTCQ